MPYFSNEEIRSAQEHPSYVPAQVLENGLVKGPSCCGEPMGDYGGCSEGCCDYYRCKTCGHKIKVEWPD